MTLEELIAIEKQAAAAQTIRRYAETTDIYRTYCKALSVNSPDMCLSICNVRDVPLGYVAAYDGDTTDFQKVIVEAAVKFFDERIAYRERQFAEMKIEP